jgi:transcriptional regulator with XRE-family HTH domain
MAHIGARIKAARHVRHYSQTDLGKAVGNVRYQTVQKWESGAVFVDVHRLIRIAQELNLPISFFFEGIETCQDSDLPFVQTSMEMLRCFGELSKQRRAAILAMMRSG